MILWTIQLIFMIPLFQHKSIKNIKIIMYAVRPNRKSAEKALSWLRGLVAHITISL
jgi:hypothetical protein